MVTQSNNIDMVRLSTYTHHETLLRFMDNFEISYEECADIFEEMKKLLALFIKYPDQYIFTHEPLWILDEMWHTFLMYSLDYENFCKEYLGRMVYHHPVERAKKMEIINNLKTNKEDTEEILRPTVRNLYSLIHDFLGRDTLVKWIKIYGEKYTMPYMNSIRKPIQ